MTPREFRRLMKEKMSLLKMDDTFATRYLNEGFSGGEKKRAEILQMALLEPTMAILDETDSGLDIDALRVVSDGVNALANESMGVLLITHYQRLLNHIKPQFVHIMMNGRIVQRVGRSWPTSSRRRATRRCAPKSARSRGAHTMVAELERKVAQVDIGEYQYGFRDEEDYVFKSERGLGRENVVQISKMKNEPEWMLDFRLKAYDHYVKRPMPNWGADLSDIDFDDIYYYIKPTESRARPGTRCRSTSRTPSSGSASPRRSGSSWPASAPSTSPRSSTTRFGRTCRSRASCSWTWTRRSTSTRSWSSSTSARSSRPTTTSSPRSTRRSGRAARSSTCRRASRSRCRCRPTSGSTPRTWASSSGR
jgi:energy-coupling factor transporter ATP-binding protein EcfA2